MTSATKASSALTSRYASALIELAQDNGNIEKVERDLNEFAAMVKDSPDLSHFIHSPSNRKTQAQVITALADKAGFDRLTKNFLGVLVGNRRLNIIESLVTAVNAELAKRRGEVTVQIETAQDLTPAQLKALQDILSKGTQRKISIQAKVEPSIMGGMIVTVGSQMIDDSVRRKLERLKQAMGRQANQNFNENQQGVK